MEITCRIKSTQDLNVLSVIMERLRKTGRFWTGFCITKQRVNWQRIAEQKCGASKGELEDINWIKNHTLRMTYF